MIGQPFPITSHNLAVNYTVACDLIGKGVTEPVCVCVFFLRFHVCPNRGQSDDSNQIPPNPRCRLMWGKSQQPFIARCLKCVGALAECDRHASRAAFCIPRHLFCGEVSMGGNDVHFLLRQVTGTSAQRVPFILSA